jgi:predicted phage terminase large subunit-like protein
MPPDAAAGEHALIVRQLEQARKRKRELEAERDAKVLALAAEAIRGRCLSLAGFVREAWHVLEPNATYIHNWHIEAICQHLEAVTDGRITRLLINVPPGSMKSLLVSVLWPAWEWGPRGLRSLRYLTSAFNDGPVKRDTRKMRDLLQSEWYQKLWPEVVLSRAGETSFANTDTGTREGVAFGSITSQRGDRFILDDPHSTKTAESPVVRQETVRQFKEGALNRLNDQVRSAIIVIMQRLNENDVSGAILASKLGYVHLMIPMEFEPERKCHTSIGWQDPREADGELLDPVRFPRSIIVKELSSADGMGPFAYAGQYQQRPTAREGGMFLKEYFEGKRRKAAPIGTRWVRYWDLAGTELKKGALRGARTAGVKMGRAPDGSFWIGDLVVAAKEGAAVRKLVKATAETDGRRVEVHLSQDPGQAGKAQAKDYVVMLAGWDAHKHIETGDKATRAEPFSAQCEIGNVYLIEGDWNDEWIDEVCLFPGGARKDVVDACSGAFGVLAPSAAGDVDLEGLVAPMLIDMDAA